MNGPFSTIALAASAIIGFSLVWTVDDLIAPQAPFMSISELDVIGSNVRSVRQIREPDRISDWQVLVFELDGNAPLCETFSGPEEGQGWSYYEAGYYERLMTLDDWVGDEGCYDRLEPGIYGMSVTWTPRDSSPAVNAYTEFTVAQDA